MTAKLQERNGVAAKRAALPEVAATAETVSLWREYACIQTPGGPVGSAWRHAYGASLTWDAEAGYRLWIAADVKFAVKGETVAEAQAAADAMLRNW